MLEDFLEKKEHKAWEESQWLKTIHADCVLSDAAFLGWYGHSYVSGSTF